MKHKKLIVMMTAGVLLVSSLAIYGKSMVFPEVKGEVGTVISFNYDGIDEGLNPHGGTMDIQSIKTEEILAKVIKTAEMTDKAVTPELLAEHIQIKGYVPNDVMERILPKAASSGVAQTQGLLGMSYHPTEYWITLQRTSELGLNKKEATQVMETLVQVYQEDFAERYKDTQVLDMAIQQIDEERYDYGEYILLAEGQLHIIEQYLLNKEKEAVDFRSQATGLTFSDLISRVEFLRDVELKNIMGVVDAFMITKNSEELKSVYANRIDNLQRTKGQLVDQKESVKASMAQYKKDPTVILDTGVIVTQPYVDQDRKVPLYEELVQLSVEIEAKLNEVNYQIHYYNELMMKLNNYEATREVAETYAQEVEANVGYIASQMETLMQTIINTTNDYYETEAFAESITVVRGADYQSAFRLELIKNTLMVGALTGIGLLLAIIIALAKEIREEKKQVA